MIDVQLAPYQGPMDLLLDLVRQSKIDIYQIEISRITDQFLEALQLMAVSTDELSDFIVMASLLVQMKARSLMKDQLKEEEEEGLSREELIQRLLDYCLFKEVSLQLERRGEEAEGIYGKLGEDLSPYQAEEELIHYEPQLLMDSFLQIFFRQEEEEKSFSYDAIVQAEEVSLLEIQKRIREKLKKGRHFSFIDLLDPSPSRPVLVASFLSLLEFSKQQAIQLKQAEGGEIQIEMLDPSLLSVEQDEEYERE